ncbi:hypothetical protein R1sor_015368 [Riccia sorocarpa]|uniref:Uncharacterized protein n=1 Tax=Riccia sorocarpa TaxID=122646 RepID=A0ABD3HI85_9MARC
MMRPRRPKYPSDSKNYHDLRRPGFAHTVRLPEELLDIYTNLKKALGPKSSHADVHRFVFETAESAISAVLQAAEPLVAQDSQVPVTEDVPAEDHMDVMQDPGAESAEENSEDDLGEDEPSVWDFTTEEYDGFVCKDSQSHATLPGDESRVQPEATCLRTLGGAEETFAQRARTSGKAACSLRGLQKPRPVLKSLLPDLYVILSSLSTTLRQNEVMGIYVCLQCRCQGRLGPESAHKIARKAKKANTWKAARLTRP